MTAPKRKVSVSLDADLVDELETDVKALSKQVNDAVRDALERRRRHRVLGQYLTELRRRHGPPPPSLVAKFEKLLG
jgi:hypothetical protein